MSGVDVSNLTTAGIEIRDMVGGDIDAVAKLCRQLGFDGTSGDAAARFAHITSHQHHVVLVAVYEEKVIGWVHVYVAPSLLSVSTAEVGGMVVDERHRRQGVGTLLMTAAERWAVKSGCQSMLLATQVKRNEAQAFYNRLGFETEFATYFMRKAKI